MSVPWLTRDGTEQRIAWLGDTTHHVILDGAATEGRLAVFRSSMAAGTASPVHVHDREDETVHVLSGCGVFWAGDQRWSLGSGDTAFLPRGVPHTYRFTSEGAQILTVCNPAGMEKFFRAAGWDLKDPKPDEWAVDMAVLAAAGQELGQRVLGPPLAEDDEMPAAHLDLG